MRFLRTYKVFFNDIFHFICSDTIFFKSDSINTIFQSSPITIKDPISNIRLGGYFRYLGYVRNFKEIYDLDIPNYYTGEYPQPTTIGIGTGYRVTNDDDFNIWKSINKSVNVGTDLMLNSPFNGSFNNNNISMYLGTNLYSTINSNFGNFGVHTWWY